MGVEIERKFLVKDDSWRASVNESFAITQGYLSRDPARTVRIRRKDAQAFLTIKGQPRGASDGAPVVPEFEYPIPPADADQLLALCLPGTIAKTRHIVMHDGHRWEVDVFHGAHTGLVLAEIELSSPTERITIPPWAGQEVTGDPRYSNAALAHSAHGATESVTPPPKP